MPSRYFCSMIRKSFIKVLRLCSILCILLILSFLISQLAFAFIDFKNTVTDVLNEQVTASIEISPELLNAIIQVESSNNPQAFNPRTKARGLTQITPVAWKELRRHHLIKYKQLKYKQDIYNPHVAREAGKDYLYIIQKYLKAKKIPLTLDHMLAAYVWGIENVSRHGIEKAPRVVKKYVSNVKNLAGLSD